MKIILSCNDHPEYRAYWPIVRWQWIYLGYEPILFHVSEDSIFGNDPLVHVVKPLEHRTSVRQSQIARIYGCTFFPNDICITSDMDCFLLQKDYLRNKWNQHNPDGKYMLAYSHGYYRDARRVGMQFIGGTGENWRGILGCDNNISWNDFMEKFPENEGHPFSTDEVVLGNMLFNNMDIRTIYLPRETEKEWRFNDHVRRFSDRIYRQYNMEYDEEKLKSGYYIDIVSGVFSWMPRVREVWDKVYPDPLPQITFL